jgi:hypothetical protein
MRNLATMTDDDLRQAIADADETGRYAASAQLKSELVKRRNAPPAPLDPGQQHALTGEITALKSEIATAEAKRDFVAAGRLKSDLLTKLRAATR